MIKFVKEEEKILIVLKISDSETGLDRGELKKVPKEFLNPLFYWAHLARANWSAQKNGRK